ncbi:type II toxin-antitoxin system RatA family toxin [Pseudomarimonas salicorniae]|uniref:Type II toxin-antitoxin system RatA family toxin n=1 Tax=Pseudomarimonas salicorniae TaxID=2933270 RepID=A0ABT0GEZ8_9GAMM|nr:type II toxin-antitoxin system RatA family toxin [Lysobacter sp. CAU 1642]MCK7593123.1 type II toxin-antitoxin system RatA family toxin [Lysobacter sp. CAU 1642]
MSRVERSALVRASAESMFGLVDDVDSYPRRFAWCDEGAVLERGEDWRVARLAVRLGGLRVSFTTRNQVEAGRSIRLKLVEGPFSDLHGHWDFVPLAENACRVSLMLDFELAGRFLGSALASGFRGFADRLVDDFVREARETLG